MDEATAARPAPSRVERLIVTRPAGESARWVQALQERGWPARSLPLIDIGEPAPPESRAALQAWRSRWHDMDALMFVSTAAVNHFFSGAVAPPPRPCNTRFWAPGPGTARELARALEPLGLAPERIDAPPDDAVQFDSEHLWPVVAGQVRPGSRILIVRGSSAAAFAQTGPAADSPVVGHGRDWLIRQCRMRGAQVEGCVAYERRVPVLAAGDLALVAQARAPGSVWLFSSSEALAPLRALHPPAQWADATALTTHPRIAQAAREAGFGGVIESRPSLPDVVRALESNFAAP